MTLKYPVKYTRHDDIEFYVGVIRDFSNYSEAWFCGDTMEEAHKEAVNTLKKLVKVYLANRELMPTPSELKIDEEWVVLNADEYAMRMLTVDELESLHHNTINTLKRFEELWEAEYGEKPKKLY